MTGEALQIAVKRREAKSKGEKERYLAAAAASLIGKQIFAPKQEVVAECLSKVGWEERLREELVCSLQVAPEGSQFAVCARWHLFTALSYRISSRSNML